MLDMIRLYNDRFVGTAIVDPLADDPGKAMRELRPRGVRAFRIQPQYSKLPPQKWLEPAGYRAMFATAAETGQALSCLIVDRGPGVEVEYLYGLMGCRGGGAGRLVFRDVRVPRENLVGDLNGAYDVFNTMMVPERLGTAAMTIGAARAALEVATGYSARRKAFGKVINEFQGVGFQVAEAAMLLDAARSLVYTTCRCVDGGAPLGRIRRMVSETKKFVTEACQKAAKNALQVMGGIGYTNVYPVERINRDLALASIWTGTSEVMAMITAHEWYREYAEAKKAGRLRDVELDAAEAGAAGEKIFE
jgi:alkylation response protein AidB-like acyl-CoA dehydrogenase